MDIWSVLGIEETKDKDILKTAYREKLKKVNPEDDQEGFMQLREAYEEALKLSDFDDSLNDASKERQGDEDFPFPVKDELRDILYEIDEIYKDYTRRIDEESWIYIFNKDEFISLDSSSDAFDMLINYLMVNFLLPHKIWKYIVDTFDVKKRKNELSEKFPKDFIDFIIDNSENIDIFNYYLFDFDTDNEIVDDFIKLYLTMNTAIRRNKIDEANNLLGKLEDMDMYHPYLRLAKLRIRFLTEPINENEDMYEDAKELYDECPDDFNITSICGDMALILNNTDDAKIYYEQLKNMEPDSVAVKVKFADLAYFTGDFEASRDAYMELLRSNNYDNNVRAGMLRANLSLIEKNSERLKEEPDNEDIRIELAWSYYQSYKFEEVIDVLSGLEPGYEKSFEYYNVKGRTYLCLLDYEKALNCFFKWKDAIDSLPEDDKDEEITKKRKRLPYVNFLIADCYLKLKKYDEAEALLYKAIETPHDEIVLSYEALCELKYETNQYEECIKACEKLIDYGDNNYIAYDYMAKSCFKLSYIKEAVDSCENAIKIYPYAADPYALEVDIFLEIGQIETAWKIVERYSQLEIESDQMLVKRAQILMREKKINEAYNVLFDALKNVKNKETDLDSHEELYSLLSLCCENMGKPVMALRYLNKLIEINPDHKSAYGRKGLIHKAGKLYKEALLDFNKQLDINPHPYFYYEKADVYKKLKKYKEAIVNYKKAVEFENDNAYIYRELGLLYEFLGRFDDALDSFDKAITRENDDDNKSKLYIFKARSLQVLNRFEEAEELYKEYEELYGIDYDYVYDYSTLLQRMNKVDAAIRLVKDNLNRFEGDKTEVVLLRHLCSLYGEEGYINLANETFKTATGKYPKDTEIYEIMGDVFRNNGLYNEAVDCYLNAISLDFNGRKNYYSNLVECMIERKNTSKATIKEFVKKAIEKGAQANSIKDYIMLAKIYRLTKKYKLALNAIEAGMEKDRCYGCFYEVCHDAIYEKGMIYEAMKKYDLARQCYTEALRIVGHCALYEKSLKRIDGK